MSEFDDRVRVALADHFRQHVAPIIDQAIHGNRTGRLTGLLNTPGARIMGEVITTSEVFGVHIPDEDVTAVYTPTAEEWTDMPEARPRARARVDPNAPADAEVRVWCLDDGTLRYDLSAVLIDRYEGDGYEQVRAEGEARWARLDREAGR